MKVNDGTFVAVEGIDGAGTTTLVQNLMDEYGDRNGVTFTKEPSDGFYGQAIRERMKVESEPKPSDFYAFLADRCDHCQNVIAPALSEGELVITDRYALSTYAYQSKIIDEELGVIDPEQYIDEMTYHFTIEPDLYLYIDIEVDEAMRRIDAEDKYEKRRILKEAKRMYDYCSKSKENVVRIPGQWSEEGIFRDAKMFIEGQWMGHWK
jgi:dTMP kinase